MLLQHFFVLLKANIVNYFIIIKREYIKRDPIEHNVSIKHLNFNVILEIMRIIDKLQYRNDDKASKIWLYNISEYFKSTIINRCHDNTQKTR